MREKDTCKNPQNKGGAVMKNNRKAVSERQLGILDLIRSRGEARVEER